MDFQNMNIDQINRMIFFQLRSGVKNSQLLSQLMEEAERRSDAGEKETILSFTE